MGLRPNNKYHSGRKIVVGHTMRHMQSSGGVGLNVWVLIVLIEVFS